MYLIKAEIAVYPEAFLAALSDNLELPHQISDGVLMGDGRVYGGGFGMPFYQKLLPRGNATLSFHSKWAALITLILIKERLFPAETY